MTIRSDRSRASFVLIAMLLPEAFGDCFFQMVSRSNLTMCLTGLNSIALMSRCRFKDASQLWIQRLYFRAHDPEGYQAFSLQNAGTELFLQHGTSASSQVTCGTVNRRTVNSSLWTSAPAGGGYLSVRSYQDSKLNLDIDHGDWIHGGVKEGNFLIVHPFNHGENQEWAFLNLKC